MFNDLVNGLSEKLQSNASVKTEREQSRIGAEMVFQMAKWKNPSQGSLIVIDDSFYSSPSDSFLSIQLIADSYKATKATRLSTAQAEIANQSKQRESARKKDM